MTTPNRTMCDVLEEMRACHRTHNYAYLRGLIEEVQSMGNRMEAAIGEKDDYLSWHNRVKKEKAKVKALIKEGNKSRKKQGKQKEEMPRYP